MQVEKQIRGKYSAQLPVNVKFMNEMVDSRLTAA